MRICIINHLSPSCNPRTVKEADALADAGHDVRVVSVNNSSSTDSADSRLLQGRQWRYEAANYSRKDFRGTARWLTSGLSTRMYRRIAAVSFGSGIAERAFCRFRMGQLKTVMREPADMYIAHNLPSLPVAAAAAAVGGAIWGFDIEDYHLDEDSPGPFDPLSIRLKAYLMGKYLPQCSHSSTTSEAMADAIVDSLHVQRPLVLYNAFPLSSAAGAAPPEKREASHCHSAAARVYEAYWVSQVIGLDRGIQDFIRAMPGFRNRINLHLRGRVKEATRGNLMELAGVMGVADRLFFHEQIHAEDLVTDASRFDFGLALEQPINTNRRVTITNKCFVYLMAGLVPIMTDTPGQREVGKEIGSSCVIYQPGDTESLIAKVNRLLAYPERMLQAKNDAWEAARARFCWDIEKGKLISRIGEIAKSSKDKHRGTKTLEDL